MIPCSTCTVIYTWKWDTLHHAYSTEIASMIYDLVEIRIWISLQMIMCLGHPAAAVLDTSVSHVIRERFCPVEMTPSVSNERQGAGPVASRASVACWHAGHGNSSAPSMACCEYIPNYCGKHVIWRWKLDVEQSHSRLILQNVKSSNRIFTHISFWCKKH